MRTLPAVLILCAACQSTSPPPGAELTRAECADLVRHANRLESADTGGMRLALTASLGAGIDGCLEKATQRGYACVKQSETVADLDRCRELFK